MERAPEESKEGLYEVFYSAEGQKIVVLEGLSIENTNETYYLQSLINQNYSSIEVFYWLLFIGSLSYVALMNLIFPLIRKYKWF